MGSTHIYGTMEIIFYKCVLTLSPLITAKMPYANSLDPAETPSNSASHQDPSCLTTILSDIEAL